MGNRKKRIFASASGTDQMENDKTQPDEHIIEADDAASDHNPDTVGENVAQPVDEMTQLRQQVADLTDKHLRAVAEQQNYMRRAATERSEMARYATAEVIRDVLTVVDDLERSLKAADTGEASLVDGVKLIHDNLLRTLAKHNVERIDSKGVPFDPNKHEALMRQPTADHPPGTVLEEHQVGYKLWDRVLRPAKVIVSSELPTASRADGDPAGTSEGNP
jgi:molecular chaperone GrpE